MRKLRKAKVPIMRPDDYYAEMLKTDGVSTTHPAHGKGLLGAALVWVGSLLAGHAQIRVAGNTPRFQ